MIKIDDIHIKGSRVLEREDGRDEETVRLRLVGKLADWMGVIKVSQPWENCLRMVVVVVVVVNVGSLLPVVQLGFVFCLFVCLFFFRHPKNCDCACLWYSLSCFDSLSSGVTWRNQSVASYNYFPTPSTSTWTLLGRDKL